jgi:hypothetical protein
MTYDPDGTTEYIIIYIYKHRVLGLYSHAVVLHERVYAGSRIDLLESELSRQRI